MQTVMQFKSPFAFAIAGFWYINCFIFAAEPTHTVTQSPSDGWISLFNGKDLTGWHQVLVANKKGVDPDAVFQVHDGLIHVYRDVPQGTAVPVGNIATDNAYSHYHFKLEFRWVGKRFAPRISRPRDAGVLYHASAEQKVWPRNTNKGLRIGRMSAYTYI